MSYIRRDPDTQQHGEHSQATTQGSIQPQSHGSKSTEPAMENRRYARPQKANFKQNNYNLNSKLNKINVLTLKMLYTDHRGQKRNMCIIKISLILRTVFLLSVSTSCSRMKSIHLPSKPSSYHYIQIPASYSNLASVYSSLMGKIQVRLIKTWCF